MTDSKNLTPAEQVELIQKILTDPKFFDDEQLIEAGIKKRKDDPILRGRISKRTTAEYYE